MIKLMQRYLKIRPALINGFVLLWAFHFSFGMFNHYHPEYLHGHDGELQAHQHGGHFHSLELEHLARFVDSGIPPLRSGETHHHSENLPGGDAESVQYDSNPSSLPKIQLAVDFNFNAAPVSIDPAQSKIFKTLLYSSDPGRILLLPQAFSERSPPLRV